jgi:pyruvate, water dikinase
MEQFRRLLDYFGQAPIIVRSSSLLEDSFGNAFAGKYRSEFCVQPGLPEERMEGLPGRSNWCTPAR